MLTGIYILATSADKATEADKANRLDYWAEAFRASTWEGLKELAGKGEVFRKVAEEMYTVNADVSQRSIAEAHRKYVETYTTLKNGFEREKKRADAEEHRANIAEQRADNAEQRANDEKQRADDAEQRADSAEARVRELEAMLKKMPEES